MPSLSLDNISPEMEVISGSQFDGSDVTLVDESMAASPSTGTIGGDASWSSSGYLLVTTAVNSQNGYFHYSGDLPENFTTSFDIYADGSADGMVFYFGTTTNSGNEEDGDGGYRIYASEYHDLIAIRFNGTIIASVAQTNLGNATWRTMEIVRSGTTFTINLDDVEVLSHTDSTRSLGGSNYGWGGRTGGLNAEHRMRNISLIQNSAIKGDKSPKMLLNNSTPSTYNDNHIPNTGNQPGSDADAHTYSYQYSPHILYSPNILYPAGWFPGQRPEMEIDNV